MRIRFIKNYGHILIGSTPEVDDKLGQELIRSSYAIEITESKNIDMPPHDKMIRRSKNKAVKR
jgi:hypothetical protein